MESVRQFEANYPETLKSAYLINANKFVTIIFNIVKPLLSARTLSKVEIYDSNVPRWKSVLLNNIPPHALPVLYGGTKTDAKVSSFFCTNCFRDEVFFVQSRPVYLAFEKSDQ